MALDLKRNWPLVGAAGLGVVALLALRSSAQGGGSQLVPVPPAGAAGAAPSGGGGGMDPSAAGLLSTYLQYEASVAGITASEYGTYIGASASDYQSSVQGQIAESQAYAAAQVANAQRPTWLQQFTGFVNAAANAYATYQSGGMYRAPSANPGGSQMPTYYYPPQQGWPSTYPGGYYSSPGLPAPSYVA